MYWPFGSAWNSLPPTSHPRTLSITMAPSTNSWYRKRRSMIHAKIFPRKPSLFVSEGSTRWLPLPLPLQPFVGELLHKSSSIRQLLTTIIDVTRANLLKYNFVKLPWPRLQANHLIIDGLWCGASHVWVPRDAWRRKQRAIRSVSLCDCWTKKKNRLWLNLLSCLGFRGPDVGYEVKLCLVQSHQFRHSLTWCETL